MNRLLRNPRLAIPGALIVAFVAFGWKPATAFNPQPDPPGFGLVSLVASQGIRLHVVCSGHGVGQLPPDPCRAALMFHDVAGNVFAERVVQLRPGQAASLVFVPPVTTVGDVVPGSEVLGINPCVIPAPLSGRVIPSAEVFSVETGRTMLYVNPAVGRLSDLQGPVGARTFTFEGH